MATMQAMLGKRVRQRTASMLLAMALVGGCMAVSAAAAADPLPSKPAGPDIAKGDPHADAAKVAPLPSASDASAEGPQAATPGDFSVQPGQPKPDGWTPAGGGFVEGKSKPVAADTTETREVFDNPDGTQTAQVSTDSVRFKDANGWHDFDTDLHAGPGGVPAADSAPASDTVAASLAAGQPVASVATSAGPVRLVEPEATSSVRAKVIDGDAVFADALPGGTDVAVSLLPHGFESTMVLPAYRADAASYDEQLVVPAGVSARSAEGGGVELVDGTGRVVGLYGSGSAADSAPDHPADVPVATVLVDQVGSTVTVRNSVDDAWLGNPARVFPVRIDPSFGASTQGTGAMDTYVDSGSPTSAYSTSVNERIGKAYGVSNVRRSLLKFDLGTLVGANRYVMSATMNMSWIYSPSCTAKQVVVAPLNSSPTTATTWNTQPSMGTPWQVSAPFAKGYSSSCPAGAQAVDVAPIVQQWVSGAANNGVGVVAASETDNLGGFTFQSAETSQPPVLLVTYDNLPTNGALASPATGTKVATTQQTLSVTPGSDVDGDPLKYWFSLSTDPSGTSGQVVSSGWLTVGTTSWTVPAGSLLDGQTYYWTAYTWDQISWPGTPPAAIPFTVDLRTGQGVWPTDQLGPATVNLTNGNVEVSTSSPSFATVGGPLGLSYAYNSRKEPTSGLVGSYWDRNWAQPASNPPAAGEQPTLVRRDPIMDFAWGTGSPGSNIGADNFYAKWTGYLSVPTTGVYNLGVYCDDGARATLATSPATTVDKWSGCSGVSWSANVTLTQGQVVPITAESWEGSGTAAMELMMKGPGLSASGQDVPATWLSTTAPTMPTGWTLSAGGDDQASYTSAVVSTTTATLTDTDGTAHRYLWDPAKSAWQPPPGEFGALNTDGAGAVKFIDEDGKTYSFGADGTLQSVQSPADDAHPAAQQLIWGTNPARLEHVKDPVSQRQIDLYYGGSAKCTTDPNFATPASGMVCAVDYGAFGAGVTQLRYNANGQLARIEDPGSEVTDFAYDAAGLLSQVRDPLAADALAAGVRSDNTSTHPLDTLIAYDANGNATSVTAPEPQAGEARPAHGYAYGTGTTDVTAAGLTSTTGKFQSVAFDDRGRPTTVTDQAGRASHQSWNAKDLPLASWDDSTGLASSTVYDDLGRATDQWGPAPSSWWTSIATGGAPTVANQATTPHATTAYDQGVAQTLAGTYWANNQTGGPPAAHSTGVDPGHGEMYGSWGSTAPAGLSPTVAFSARFTGWVNVTSLAPIDFQMPNTKGYGRLVIDNKQEVIGLSASPATFSSTSPYTPTTTGWKQIELDYAEPAVSVGSFDLTWRTGGGAFTRIPASSLQTGYGLATSNTDRDGRTSTTSYAATGIDPYLGIATSSTVDPGTGHLNLTSTTTVEAPGSGSYLRETAHTLPSGNDSKVATSYYGDTATADVPCPSGDPGVNQGGMTKTVAAANPAGGGGAGGIVRETIYDKATRPAATRVQVDGSNWTCSTYDTRGRTTKVTVPDLAGAPGHVVTNDYAVSGNPLASSSTDTVTGGTARTITTVVDLLGRPRSYTDGWGKTTTTTYDQVGRPTTVVSALGTQTMTYDATGADGPTVLDGTIYATPHYDPAGRLSWVDYGNGTKSDAVTYDAMGREVTSVWRKTSDNSVLASDAETMSLGGKVTKDVTDGNDAHPGLPDYSYDGAGRLTDAWTTARGSAGTISNRHTAYGFGAPSGCAAGSQANAGLNTNRTSQTVGDGGSAVTTSYCYDSADRLVSTTEAGVGTPVYDNHGNTTTLYGEARRYDAADRHIETVKGTTDVTYVRDATDRIISRTSTVTGTSTDVERYGFTGDGDTPDFTMDATGAVIERDLGLPGGVSVTLRSSGQVWSYPNMHGDVVLTTDAAGVKQGVTHTYDPYGNTTGQSIVENSAGNYDYGWLGEKQRGEEHEAGLAGTIEMGARQYDPVLGRFLEVDPVLGGSLNSYEYSNGDPVNGFDFDGKRSHKPYKTYGRWKSMPWYVFGIFGLVDGCFVAFCSHPSAKRRSVTSHYWENGAWHTSVRYQVSISVTTCAGISFGPIGFAFRHGCHTTTQTFYD